jgi:hypothetical protein
MGVEPVSEPIELVLTNALLLALSAGHKPGIYRRGDMYRVHLDVGGNTWEDVESQAEAAMWLREKLGVAQKGLLSSQEGECGDDKSKQSPETSSPVEVNKDG